MADKMIDYTLCYETTDGGKLFDEKMSNPFNMQTPGMVKSFSPFQWVGSFNWYFPND